MPELSDREVKALRAAYRVLLLFRHDLRLADAPCDEVTTVNTAIASINVILDEYSPPPVE